VCLSLCVYVSVRAGAETSLQFSLGDPLFKNVDEQNANETCS